VADCILGIMTLKRAPLVSMSLLGTPIPPRKPRIMYLDLDLHFSDAVSEAFSSQSSSGSPQILVRRACLVLPGTLTNLCQTFSIHHSAPGFFPVSPLSQLPSLTNNSFDPFTLSLPLRQGASDGTFSRVWHIVEQVKDAFAPDYIILQCGLDSLAEDPCATFNWSLTSLGWCVDRVINHWRGRKLLLGGGKLPLVHN
jgi:histone deacetylase 8